jgi:hypothetical protein
MGKCPDAGAPVSSRHESVSNAALGLTLTPRGPVIMEMNFIGDIVACQIHGPPGIYTKQYLSFRDTHTYPAAER